MLEMLSRMIAHLRWADLATLDSLRRADQPGAKALDLYAHVLGAEHVWLARLRQEPASVAVWPSLTLDECDTLAAENVRGIEEFVASLAPGDLAREVAYTNSAGQAFRSTIADILVHLALHGSYHRGQVALLVRQGGAEPAMTDYIAFVRGAPTATRQDEAANPPG